MPSGTQRPTHAWVLGLDLALSEDKRRGLDKAAQPLGELVVQHADESEAGTVPVGEVSGGFL